MQIYSEYAKICKKMQKFYAKITKFYISIYVLRSNLLIFKFMQIYFYAFMQLSELYSFELSKNFRSRIVYGQDIYFL